MTVATLGDQHVTYAYTALDLLARNGPVSTPWLAQQLWPAKVPQQAQARTGDLLRAHEDHGRVRRAGTILGGRNVPCVMWELTPAGRAWLSANHPDILSARKQQALKRAEEHRRHAEVEQATRAAILADAKARYGPGAPPALRRAGMRELRAAGLTLQSIGDVFGVTREMARLVLLDKRN